MKAKLLLALIMPLLKAQSHKKIEVYLNFNECVKCYVALNELNNLKDYTKVLVIAKADSLLAKEFLGDYTLAAPLEFKYINKKASPLSYCKVFANNLLVDSFGLMHISNKMKHINQPAFSKNKTRTFKLPPTVILNFERLDIQIQNNFVNIFDYTLNKNVLIELHPLRDTIKRITEVKGKEFEPRQFLRAGHLDSALFLNCYEMAKREGWAYAHVESSYLTDSCISYLLNFPNAYTGMVQGKYDTIIDMSFYLYRVNLFNNNKDFAFIADRAMTARSRNRYMLDNSKPFFARADKLVLSISDFKMSDDKLKLLVQFYKSDKGIYEYEKFDSVRLDKRYYQKNKLEKHGISLNNQFYFDYSLKLLIDHSVSKVIYLKDCGGEGWAALDVIQNHNTLKILASNNGKVELIVYDLKTDKIIEKSNPEIADCFIGSLKFYNANTLFFINKNNSQIKLQGINF